ncbi:MAG TPA: 5-formyltetrahydrofolate cyclo-ligase [Polyangiaceae bacterium]|nr:5-formyltetrahydrofolate cyclo-ligase [Polyangiaceae bacterium]
MTKSPPHWPAPGALPDLDEETLRLMTGRAKIQIRKRMKSLRSGFSRAALAARSAAIVQRIMAEPEFERAQAVALFWPMLERGEVDLRALDQTLRSRGARVYYPFMNKTGPGSFVTGFELTQSIDDLVESPQGFAQPKGEHPAKPGDIDLVLVPALAADAVGHRVGYGAGFYDATLGDVRPPSRAWIVAYHFQLLAELPHEPHDQACDAIITDETTHWAVATAP